MTNRVTTRAIGSIPHCNPAEPSFLPFDERKYWISVLAFCAEISDYIWHMELVRSQRAADTLVKQPELAA